jgi:hypothetical protein
MDVTNRRAVKNLKAESLNSSVLGVFYECEGMETPSFELMKILEFVILVSITRLEKKKLQLPYGIIRTCIKQQTIRQLPTKGSIILPTGARGSFCEFSRVQPRATFFLVSVRYVRAMEGGMVFDRHASGGLI